MRTLVHAVEAAIKMTDPHGQTVFIDLMPDGINAVTVEVTKMMPPTQDTQVIAFMIEVRIPPGSPCVDCGHVHDQAAGEHGEQQEGEHTQ